MPEDTPLRAVLEQASARFVEEAGWLVADDFGDAAKEYRHAVDDSAIFDVSSRSKVELAGCDTLMFLHNLCTQDVKGLRPGDGCEAFLTTAKAKVVAHLFLGRYVSAAGDVILLDTVAGQADKILQHLNHFLISEQVELTDRTGSLAQLHVCGPQAQLMLEGQLGESVSGLGNLQIKGLSGANDEGSHVRRNDLLGMPGFDLFFSRDKNFPSRARESWLRLSTAGATPAGRQAWEILRIEAGTPEYGKDIDDNRLAMEVGRTSQAISYDKGCYLGQETIVMARDRGHVNRSLLGLRISGDRRAASGTKVFHQDQEVGQVTSSVVSPRFGAIALAYLRRGFQAEGMELILDPAQDGRAARVASLPFTLP